MCLARSSVIIWFTSKVTLRHRGTTITKLVVALVIALLNRMNNYLHMKHGKWHDECGYPDDAHRGMLDVDEMLVKWNRRLVYHNFHLRRESYIYVRCRKEKRRRHRLIPSFRLFYCISGYFHGRFRYLYHAR